MKSKPIIIHEKVYQLKIHIVGLSPMIWRRIIVHENTSIAKLNGIIQIVMGWENEHLHAFRIFGKSYGIGYTGGMIFSDDPRQVFLKDFKFREGEKFFYDYNFNIDWKHQVRVEKILEVVPSKFYPRCTAGNNACPPEEIQSLTVFEEVKDLYEFPMHDLLKIIRFQEYVGYSWRPDHFNKKTINFILQQDNYDCIGQFSEVVSIHESPYYEDEYWFKKGDLQDLKKMYSILKFNGIEVKDESDGFSSESTGLKVMQSFLEELLKPEVEDDMTSNASSTSIDDSPQNS